MPSIYEMTAEALSVLELNSTERMADNANSAAAQRVAPLSWEMVYCAAGQVLLIADTFSLPFGMS
jgi:hypothetical protein